MGSITEMRDVNAKLNDKRSKITLDIQHGR
jgi:hypothetical protein